MKKILMTIVMAVLLLPAVRAQMDTVQWKCNRYHYSVWYDTLPEFHQLRWDSAAPALRLTPWSFEDPTYLMAFPQHVDRPTRIYGVAVTEAVNPDPQHTARNQWYTSEYVYLFQKVGDTVELRDSARWDTVTPKLMKIVLNADTLRWGIQLVKVYEAMFKEPVLVDSVFYTMSSNNGCRVHCGSTYYNTEYLPVEPMTVFNWSMIHYPSWCPLPSWWELKLWNDHTREWGEYWHHANSPLFGGYFPIVDYVELIVESSDTAMGIAGPVAHVARNMAHNIYAVPKRGYRFSHWQEDGGIHAMRSVYVVQDTTRFTAVFEPAARYRVEGRSDDETMGYVRVDDSVHYEGDTAVLEAFAAAGMKFRGWSNGSVENPLRLVVESDTVVTAHFSPLGRYRVEGRSNDEAKGYVRVDDSVHYEGDTALLEAFPETGCVFSSWSTGDTANPLRLVVESDTVVMAFFARGGAGIAPSVAEGAAFALSPNPARGVVSVTLAEAAARGTVLRVHDVAGREVLRRELAAGTQKVALSVADYPSGTYFVTLTTTDGTGTQRLVVK
jgi:hypothetical protein